MTSSQIEILWNGEKEKLPEETILASFLEQKGYGQSYFAVAINSEFVPRLEYGQKSIQPGDEVEILAPMQGG